MGIISLTNTDRLYWLGRYSERVYTTIRLFTESFDGIIDGDAGRIRLFCESLGIPDIYISGEDFVDRYLFDPENPDSVTANLTRAFDNAMTLREEIGSECVSYIEMAVCVMSGLRGNQSPALGLQEILDHILAFWGLADDMIADENVRNIIKTGKRIERLDLYARLGRPRADILREVHRLSVRISRTELVYSLRSVDMLLLLAEAPEPDTGKILKLVDNLVEL